MAKKLETVLSCPNCGYYPKESIIRKFWDPKANFKSFLRLIFIVLPVAFFWLGVIDAIFFNVFF